jgi:hypothetical protein
LERPYSAQLNDPQISSSPFSVGPFISYDRSK